MKLQKMFYKEDHDCEEEEEEEVVCAVNLVQNGGEYTMCGNAIVDSTIENSGFEKVGNEYEGKLKDVTCANCIKIISFVKGFK